MLTPGRFYRRRLAKVWLPYVLALTISLLAAFLFDLFPDRWGAWLAGVGLYQMFSEPYIHSFGGHFWFISTIVQFYLLFPFLKKIQQSIGDTRFFWLALAVSVAWWLVVAWLGKGEFRTWNSCCLQFLWEFALGMVLAKCTRMNDEFTMMNAWRKRQKYWWALLPIGLFFTGLMVVMILKLGPTGRIFNDIPALLGYTALSGFFFCLGNLYIPALRRFFLWISGFSFSLYLIHVLVLEAYLHLLPSPPTGWQILGYLPLALLAGWAFEPLSRWWTGFFEGRSVDAAVRSTLQK